MENNITITFLANTAILIQFGEVKFLIDGIYDKNGHIFSNLTTNQWQDLKRGNGILSNIDYLLFTHEHGDHFSPERTMQYISYQKPKAVFMPKNGSKSLETLKKMLEQMKIPCALLDEKNAKRTKFFLEKDIFVEAFQTRHLDKVYQNVPHFCFLLSFCDKKLLITADVDLTTEYFYQINEIALEAIFVNPLFYHSKQGQKILQRLNSKINVVYHIPFEEDDKMRMRKWLQRDLEKQTDKRVIALLERGKQFIL